MRLGAEPPKWDAEIQRRIEERAYGPISIDGPAVEERIWRSVQNQVGAEGITMRYVEVVLHALADYSLQQRMLSPAVADLAIRPLAYGSPAYPEQEGGLARWFHGVADRLERIRWEEENREAAAHHRGNS